jgi:hypothetical protein
MWQFLTIKALPKTLSTILLLSSCNSDSDNNIWEWIWDWYEVDFYSISPEFDPTCPEDSGFRI